MRFANWASSALLVVSVAACSSSPAVPTPTNQADPTDLSQQSDPTPETLESQPVVQADIADWPAIQQWVADQQGKVVVVDVWSTSCLPCVKEFPHFVALQEELDDKIACASVNIDYYGVADETPEDVKPHVLEFLTSKRATMQNFVSNEPDEEILKKIETASIPAVLVYDRDGKLHTTFNNDDAAYGPGGFNYADDITPLVKQLLE